MELRKISLNLGNWPECDYINVVVYVSFYYKEKTIGEYKIVYNLNGEVYDDYFVIY